MPYLPLSNLPGQSSIAYRLGIYATFYQVMIDLLPRQTVPTTNQDEPKRPLAALKMRDRTDLAIALLDSWAVVCDVITFYQERIANEGYLRTAQQQRSVLELARAIGYEFDPGVAASAWLAFNVTATEDGGTVFIPRGTQVQSTPPQGQLPQTFETSDAITARPAWNSMRPQVARPQTLDIGANHLDLAGTSVQLQPGQPLLLYNQAQAGDLVIVQNVTADTATGTTRVSWQPPVSANYLTPVLFAFRQQTQLFGYNAPEWNLLPPAIQSQYCPTMPAPVLCVAVSPSRTFAASGQADGSIILWSFGSKIKQATRFIAHNGAVLSVAISPDGQSLLSGGADGSIKLWDSEGKLQQTFTAANPMGAVNSVAFSPTYAGDKAFLSGSADGIMRLWTVGGGLPTPFPNPKKGAINSVAFAPNYATNKQVLSGDDNHQLILWSSPQQSITFTEHTAAVRSVAFSPNYTGDHQLLSGSADKSLMLWNADTQASQSFTGHIAGVNSVAFSPNYATDHQFLSGSDDTNVILWQATSFTPFKTLSRQVLGVNGVAFTPNPGVLTALSASNDTTLVYWNLSPDVWAPSQVLTQDLACPGADWPKFPLTGDTLDLATLAPTITVGSDVVLWANGGTGHKSYTVKGASSHMASDFMLSGMVTTLILDELVDTSLFSRRDTIVLSQRQPLQLAAAPILDPLPPCTNVPPEDVASGTIELSQLVDGLFPGQQLALSGEIYDCKNQRGSGISASEIVTIEQATLDQTHTFTRLILRKPLETHYVRSSVSLNGNVALATNGETVRSEILGSGDGLQPNQQFTLRQQPLTYVSAPTSSGSQSTLSISVNHVQWHEARSFYGLDARSRSYIVQTDEAGWTTATFGDGVQGARLPNGQENVVASYRVGLGLSGEVDAGALSQLKNKPLGVDSVTNPKPATGAAPPDTRDSARSRAPLTVATLGRIVSLQDYDDFTRAFAGIGRARTSLLWNGRSQVIHITVLGADGKPVPEESALYTSLVQAIDAARAPAQPVIVQSGPDMIQKFKVAGRIIVWPDDEPARVRDAVVAALQQQFALEQRQFGQGVAASDVIAAIQAVPGVIAVDLTGLCKLNEPADPEPCPVERYLDVELAHWDKQQQRFVPDQILAIDKEHGIELTVGDQP
jgi:WD40 repeat protein